MVGLEKFWEVKVEIWHWFFFLPVGTYVNEWINFNIINGFGLQESAVSLSRIERFITTSDRFGMVSLTLINDTG